MKLTYLLRVDVSEGKSLHIHCTCLQITASVTSFLPHVSMTLRKVSTLRCVDIRYWLPTNSTEETKHCGLTQGILVTLCWPKSKKMTSITSRWYPGQITFSGALPKVKQERAGTQPANAVR